MVPVFNSHPYHSNQVQTNGNTATAPQQQVMPSNQIQGNPSNLLPQIQSQMGIINPQMPIRFNNSNTHLLGNGNNTLMNPLQNGMSPLGQFPGGYGPQNLNAMAMNQFNKSQLSQLFSRNSMNQAPYFNQNISLPNGQFYMQGPLQNLGQFVQMQMPDLPLQVSQGRGPHNPAFIVNQQLGMMHFNGIAQHGNQEQKLPNTTQQLGISSLQPVFGSVQPQQTQNFWPPVFTNQQANPRKDNAISKMTTNGKNSQSRNFTRHLKHEASQGRFKKPRGHVQNVKGKFKFHNERGGKGYENVGAKKSVVSNPSNQTQVEKTKSLSLHYTEQEILQWRNARKINFPSKSNLEKKLKKNMAEPELTDRDAELRRQQLKEVLAKQVELGCEVAEIPSHYLSDSVKQVHGQEENKRAFNKMGRSRNKFTKRGKREMDRFSKKQRPSNTDSAILNDQTNVFNQKQRMRNNDPSTRPITNTREPTLLQKLLGADIRRDRGRLLQVFRFMVTNSFFKDQPEKPLIFPLVTVKETEGEDKLVEEKSSFMAGDCFEGEKTITRNCNDNGGNEDDFTEAQVNETGNEAMEEGSIGKGIKGVEEEEGEIID